MVHSTADVQYLPTIFTAAFCLGSVLLLSNDFARVVPQRDELDVPDVVWAVHSRNSRFATSSGLNQTHSFILAAVSPCPHLPLFGSGRF